jgi:hypothetical protein
VGRSHSYLGSSGTSSYYLGADGEGFDSTKKAGKNGASKKPGAKSAIAVAVKDLPPAIQAAILALVKEASG